MTNKEEDEVRLLLEHTALQATKAALKAVKKCRTKRGAVARLEKAIGREEFRIDALPRKKEDFRGVYLLRHHIW